MKRKAWILIDTKQYDKYAMIYCNFDQPYGVRDASAYWRDFYQEPISNQYKLLEDANNGYDPLKCKKDNLSKLKKLLRLNRYTYKENK